MHLPKKIWRSSLSAFRPNVKCLLNEYVNSNLQTIRQGALRFYSKALFSRNGSVQNIFLYAAIFTYSHSQTEFIQNSRRLLDSATTVFYSTRMTEQPNSRPIANRVWYKAAHVLSV